MLCRATSLGPVRCKWRKYRPYILVSETESNKPVHKYHIVSGNKCWGEKDNQEGAYTIGWGCNFRWNGQGRAHQEVKNSGKAPTERKEAAYSHWSYRQRKEKGKGWARAFLVCARDRKATLRSAWLALGCEERREQELWAEKSGGNSVRSSRGRTLQVSVRTSASINVTGEGTGPTQAEWRLNKIILTARRIIVWRSKD